MALQHYLDMYKVPLTESSMQAILKLIEVTDQKQMMKQKKNAKDKKEKKLKKKEEAQEVVKSVA
jgi:hypothetical protein